MLDLVGNPEDRFSRVEALIIVHDGSENELSGTNIKFLFWIKVDFN